MIRGDFEYISKKSLERSSELKSNYMKEILSCENRIQCEELLGKSISLVFDATPRQGDVFNVVARFVDVAKVKY